MQTTDGSENRSGAQAQSQWTTPRLDRSGLLRDMVRGGGGKLSVTGGDMGDNRKPPGGG